MDVSPEGHFGVVLMETVPMHCSEFGQSFTFSPSCSIILPTYVPFLASLLGETHNLVDYNVSWLLLVGCLHVVFLSFQLNLLSPLQLLEENDTLAHSRHT